MSELETIYPEYATVKVGGEEVQIKPFTFGQLVKVTKLLKPMVGALQTAGIWSTEKRDSETFFKLADDWPLRIVDAMAEGGDSFMEFLAFATGKPRAWLEDIKADEGIALAKGVFEVNADFFGRKIVPLLQTAQRDGPTLSPSSLPEATSEPTSTATPLDNSSSSPPLPSETVSA